MKEKMKDDKERIKRSKTLQRKLRDKRKKHAKQLDHLPPLQIFALKF